jgi:hypothetical protein
MFSKSTGTSNKGSSSLSSVGADGGHMAVCIRAHMDFSHQKVTPAGISSSM